jgi:hypothetical protein
MTIFPIFYSDSNHLHYCTNHPNFQEHAEKYLNLNQHNIMIQITHLKPQKTLIIKHILHNYTINFFLMCVYTHYPLI